MHSTVTSKAAAVSENLTVATFDRDFRKFADVHAEI